MRAGIPHSLESFQASARTVRAISVLHLMRESEKYAYRLLVRLMLREASSEEDNLDDTKRYVIESQEDFYHPEDITAIVLPPLVPFVHLALRFGSFASALNAKVFGMLGTSLRWLLHYTA